MAAKFKSCSIEGCNGNAAKPGAARGWCTKHYQRWQRSGNPQHVDIERGAPMSFIETIASFCDAGECLIWPFSKDRHGYGQLWFQGALIGAHRLVCIKRHGPAPSPHHDAAHNCGNGHNGCVNGSHLRWATRSENLSDMAEHGTKQIGSKSSSSKLTNNDVREIRRLAKTMRQKDIATQFGVSSATISAVVNRTRWKHVE